MSAERLEGAALALRVAATAADPVRRVDAVFEAAAELRSADRGSPLCARLGRRLIDDGEGRAAPPSARLLDGSARMVEDRVRTLAGIEGHQPGKAEPHKELSLATRHQQRKRRGGRSFKGRPGRRRGRWRAEAG